MCAGFTITDARARTLLHPQMAMANAGVVLRQAAEALVQGSLSDLVTRIRRNKGKDESAFLASAIQAIRKELRSTSKDVKAVAVQKVRVSCACSVKQPVLMHRSSRTCK